MDGDRLLGTPVDTGKAMAAMRTYNCLLSCTNNITDWTDTGTKAAGNTASPIDRRRQPAFSGMADRPQIHEPRRQRRMDGRHILNLPVYLICRIQDQLISMVQTVYIIADVAPRGDGTIGNHRQDSSIRQGTMLMPQEMIHRLKRPASRTATSGNTVKIG